MDVNYIKSCDIYIEKLSLKPVSIETQETK